MISLEVLVRTPIGPAPAFTRSVLAYVFNIDMTPTSKLTVQQAAVVLAYKLFNDMGHKPEHLGTIFRFFKDSIERWDPASIGMLNISDNRHAMFIDSSKSLRVLDYRESIEVTELKQPVFQTSVNLRALAALLEACERDLSSSRSAAAVAAAATKASPSGS